MDEFLVKNLLVLQYFLQWAYDKLSNWQLARAQ